MGILIALLGVLLVLCICDVRMRWAYYLDSRNRFDNGNDCRRRIQ